MAKRQLVKKQSLTLNKTFRQYVDWEEGDIVVGKIVGQHKDNYEKQCAVIEVESSFFKGEKDDSLAGKNLVLNTCGSLTKALVDGGIYDEDSEKFVMGTILQVEYKGKVKIVKGTHKGKDAHVVNVDVMGEADETTEEEEVDL